MYTKENGTIVYKDYDVLLDVYETKICNKIVQYKFEKIFAKVEDPNKVNERKSTYKKPVKEVEKPIYTVVEEDEEEKEDDEP